MSTETLMQEWEEASIARESGDSDQAKLQALATARFVIAETGVPVGTHWNEIPEEARDAALATLTMRSKDLGLSITRAEITRQAQSVIERNFVLPEALAYKVVYEMYHKDPEVTAERHRKVDLMLRVAQGERVDPDEIPENIQTRIQRRVTQHKRYPICATDLREACGRRGYLVHSNDVELDADEALEALVALAKTDAAFRKKAQAAGCYIVAEEPEHRHDFEPPRLSFWARQMIAVRDITMSTRERVFEDDNVPTGMYDTCVDGIENLQVARDVLQARLQGPVVCDAT